MRKQISSKNHKAVKRLKRLRKRTFRDREGVFLIEGMNVLKEATHYGAELSEVFFVPELAENVNNFLSNINSGYDAYEVAEELMNQISDVVTSQGIAGIVNQVDVAFESLLSRELSLVVIASRVRDPGNLGALIRVADASGADGFITTPGCVDMYNPKVVRSASGSHFHIPLVREIPLEMTTDELRSKGVRIFGLDAHSGTSYLDEDYKSPCAIVVGNETRGFDPEDELHVDALIKIEMPGRAESLNVAQAASIVLFEVLRQRRKVVE